MNLGPERRDSKPDHIAVRSSGLETPASNSSGLIVVIVESPFIQNGAHSSAYTKNLTLSSSEPANEA
jgi:hypothetical protein